MVLPPFSPIPSLGSKDSPPQAPTPRVTSTGVGSQGPKTGLNIAQLNDGQLYCSACQSFRLDAEGTRVVGLLAHAGTPITFRRVSPVYRGERG